MIGPGRVLRQAAGWGGEGMGDGARMVRGTRQKGRGLACDCRGRNGGRARCPYRAARVMRVCNGRGCNGRAATAREVAGRGRARGPWRGDGRWGAGCKAAHRADGAAARWGHRALPPSRTSGARKRVHGDGGRFARRAGECFRFASFPQMLYPFQGRHSHSFRDAHGGGHNHSSTLFL